MRLPTFSVSLRTLTFASVLMALPGILLIVDTSHSVAGNSVDNADVTGPGFPLWTSLNNHAKKVDQGAPSNSASASSNQAFMAGPNTSSVAAPAGALAAVNYPMRAQRSNQVAVALSNFDVRTARDSASTAYVAGFVSRLSPAAVTQMASAQKAGLAKLSADLNAIEIINSPELGALELVSAKLGSGFLRGPTMDRVQSMRGFLSEYCAAYGLSQEQVNSLELVADYTNPAGNMAWVEFEQRINGLPVFQGLLRGGFTARGELARITGPPCRWNR